MGCSASYDGQARSTAAKLQGEEPRRYQGGKRESAALGGWLRRTASC
jgi:hypothetical protein